MSTDPQNTKQKTSGKKAKKLSQNEQSERFIETARELDCEENSDAFEKIMSVIKTKSS